MLHELLLAVSGHASPLLSLGEDPKADVLFGQLVSPAERALVRSLVHLGSLQSDIRTQASSISSSRCSVVCRAVAAAVVDVHLARFQDKILSFESSILRKDAYFVGAYETVSLSMIACAFDGWRRPLEWLQDLVRFIHQSDRAAGPSGSVARTGSALINRLRSELHTGYPDIESLALQLVEIAELAWLRQASSWLLYGRLPQSGSPDFFVQDAPAQQNSPRKPYQIHRGLLPSFVSFEAASSALAIGRSLDYINHHAQGGAGGAGGHEGLSIVLEHTRLLSALKHPITASSFQRTLLSIRENLSQKALQKLLPATKVASVLDILHEFFLLNRSDFAESLLSAADKYLAEQRSRGAQKGYRADGARSYGGSFHQGEVSSVLNRAWAALYATSGLEDEDEDEQIETARELVKVQISKSHPKGDHHETTFEASGIPKKIEDLFHNALCPVRTSLMMSVPPPIDLFLSSADVRAYSNIHNYLLSIRAHHLHLCQLWKLTILRRTPSDGVGGGSRKQSWMERNRSLRAVWSTASSAAFLTGGLWSYFKGEVIAPYGQSFRSKVSPPSSSPPTSDRGPLLHDPEVLMQKHATELSALGRGLLLTDAVFPSALHSLFQRCDHLIALIHRLAGVHQTTLALFGTGNSSDGALGIQEEQGLQTALDKARGEVDEALRKVTTRLKEIDRDGLTISSGGGQEETDREAEGKGDGHEGLATSWSQSGVSGGGGLERLLVRLDLNLYQDD